MSLASAHCMPSPAWSFGGWEVVVILVAVVLLFGAKRIPELARGLGKGMKEFRSELHGKGEGEGESSDTGPAGDSSQDES